MKFTYTIFLKFSASRKKKKREVSVLARRRMLKISSPRRLASFMNYKVVCVKKIIKNSLSLVWRMFEISNATLMKCREINSAALVFNFLL
jgi:hypothetical protein